MLDSHDIMAVADHDRSSDLINARNNPILHPCLILCPLIGAVFLGTEPVVKKLTEDKQRYYEDEVGPSPGIGEVAECQSN